MGNNIRSDIAINTVLLYVRMAVVMVINLLAVRFVLRSLGEVDYGVFNAVAGVVLVLSSLSAVLSSATQRYYSVAIGRGENDSLRTLFSVSMNIFALISILVLVFGETVGLWLVNTHLSIPEDRMIAANWIYQFSILTFILSLFQQPYFASIIAHHEMQFFTIISSVECLLKFGAAIVIAYIPFDHLSIYGALLVGVSLLTLVMYMIVGKLRYQECHYCIVRDVHIHADMIRFSGWTLFGGAANVGVVQVVTLLTSAYFGPVVTASRAIALQICNAMIAFCSSFCLALRPPMMEAIAASDIRQVRRLYNMANLFILLSMVIISIPLIVWMPEILKLWLGEANEDMIVFSRLIIIYTTILAMNNPVTIWMHAIGKVKEYHLPVESVMMLCMPITWILYAIGMPAVSAYWVMIIVALMAHAVRLICLRKYTKQHGN